MARRLTPPATRLTDLERLREKTIDYLRAKVGDEDWHGVSDAANDLREIDVELRVLSAIKG